MSGMPLTREQNPGTKAEPGLLRPYTGQMT